MATAVGGGAWTLDVDGHEVTAAFKFADVFPKGRRWELAFRARDLEFGFTNPVNEYASNRL